MKKLLFSLLFLMFPLVSCSFSQEEKQSFKIDTSNWITYPVGRYFINLPPSAKITYWYPLKFGGKFILKEVKNKTLEEAKKELLQEAEEAKKLPHKKDENQLVFYTTDFMEGTVFLSRRPNEFAESKLLKMYFESVEHPFNPHLEKKLFYYEEQVIDLLENSALDFATHIMQNTFINDSSLPYTRNHFVYFEGGMLAGPNAGVKWATEEVGIEFTMLEYPGITFSLYIQNSNSNIEIDELNSVLAGRKSHEKLEIFKAEGSNVSHYRFSIESPNEAINGNGFATPYISMRLENIIGGVTRNGVSNFQDIRTSPSFSSDKEAFELWNELKKGLRRRPDGEINKTLGPLHYFIIDSKEVEVF